MNKYSKFFGLIFAIVLSIGIFVFRDKLIGLQGYGYIGLFLLNIAGSATLVLPTPLFLTAFAAASVYNPLIVAIVASLGSAVGELTGYAAGTTIGKLSKGEERIKGWIDKYGLWAIFILAAVPNPLFDFAGIVAGATGIPIYKYLLVVWAGKLIKFSLIAGSANIIIR